MQPLGRKHFKGTIGCKHTPKWGYTAWWEDLIEPSKKRARQTAKAEIRSDLEFLSQEDEHNFLDFLVMIELGEFDSIYDYRWSSNESYSTH
jgi:hypothetical protein